MLCGGALFGIMALTFFDVAGRKFLSQSIPGSLELTEGLMVVVIFAALPLVSRRGEHVVFDSLDPYLPSAVRRAQRVAVQLACAATLLALGILMWKTAGTFMDAGETTVFLKIRKAPFIYGMAAMCALAGAVHVALVLPRHAEGRESAGPVL